SRIVIAAPPLMSLRLAAGPTLMKPTLEETPLLGRDMKGEVTWTGAGGYIGTTGGGKSFNIYGEDSPSPTEMLIHAHAACSLIDVVGGLKERVDNVEFATIEIEVEMAEDYPKVITSIHMKYIIKGDIPEVLVRRLIEGSHEKYCRVGIMITRSGASLDWELEMLS
ncbi:MAG TPA: OsmC family protein, partial [Candidatus Thalassarchaeaceae archaeon]|nr:OsmC family protein [Candidatus Thalassarchaeaceae archaeon]